MDELLEYELNNGKKSLVEMMSEYTDSQIIDMHKAGFYWGDSSVVRRKNQSDNPLVPYIAKFWERGYTRYFFTEQSENMIKYDKSGLDSAKTDKFFDKISYAIIDKEGNLYKALISDVLLADWLRKNKVDINGSVSVMFLEDKNNKINGVDFFDTAYSKEGEDPHHFVTINEKQVRTMFNMCRALNVSLEEGLFHNTRLGFVKAGRPVDSSVQKIIGQVRYNNFTTLLKELGSDFNMDKVNSLVATRKR